MPDQNQTPTTTPSTAPQDANVDASFKIAVISTAYYLRSHSDVITTRWTTKRPGDKDWGWDGPSSTLASIHIEQIKDNDTGVAWAKENHVPLMKDVESAITLGGDDIAVDAVLLIGEHGDYPKNEFDQKTYPRKALFDKIASTFQKYGKTLPVFCDKHYSYDATWAHRMVDTAEAMDFKLLGGSSIPHTPFVPKCTLKTGFKPASALAVYYGDNEAYQYHSIEFAQSVLEKRQGGETGIAAVTTWQGPEAWAVIEEHFGGDLLNAAIDCCPPARSRPTDDMTHNCEHWSKKSKDRVSPVLTILHYADGLNVGHVNLNGHVEGWSMAIQTQDKQIHPIGSTAAGEDLWYAHFATFSKLVETFFKTNQYPFPPERALLTTCAIASAMRALKQPGVRCDSPVTMIPYQPMVDLKYHPDA